MEESIQSKTIFMQKIQAARLAQSVEHGTLTLLIKSARDIPGSWVRAPHRAHYFLPVVYLI